SLRASEELLQTQQEELQQTNEELQEKAELLSQQNRDIEVQNAEIERARESLEEKAEQLALSSKYKSEFLANMSHELRTPLNSLLILSKLLAENPDENLTDKQIEFASTIHTAGADLLSIISDILDLSKVEAGKMEITPGQIELGSIRGYVERAFGSIAEQKGLAFEVVTADDAPPAIFTDEQRLQQVLRNLLSNAFKFTEAGQVELAFNSSDERAPDGTPYALSITVRDTGIGIAEDKLRLILEPFQQADGTTSRRFGGTGLGLSICREVARILGGEIRVSSEPGSGSAFTLLLPNYTEPAPALEPPAQTDLAVVDLELGIPDDDPAAPADDRALIVDGDRLALIVEDDPDAAGRALEQARGHGFRGVVALRGNLGLALAHDLGPDVILLSVPVRGGAGILDQLKHHPRTRHVPVHVVADAQERYDALRAGAAGYLERPATAEALAATFIAAAEFLDRPVRQLLVVDDDEGERLSVSELVGSGEDVEVTAVGSSEEALVALESRRFDCILLDLKLPKMTGFALLDHLKADEDHGDVPVIVHTGKQLTRREETRLRRYADSIIVKDASSPERLLDETSLFLHRPQTALPAESRRVLEQLHMADAALQGKRVMIVDDDVRNVFALTSALEARGMTVRFAENGREAIDSLHADPGVDLVLMDVMMPEMDGHETTIALRADERFTELPIIALTAKAMKGDREKSIAAGASDYITKPVDIEQLISLMRVWLYS
ncbi:MAG: response regulator, partial [Actinomycetota bacterium]|nr:response regulator [Actinomycetota bacterium]